MHVHEGQVGCHHELHTSKQGPAPVAVAVSTPFPARHFTAAMPVRLVPAAPIPLCLLCRFSAASEAHILWGVGIRERGEVAALMERLSAAGLPTLDISGIEAAQARARPSSVTTTVDAVGVLELYVV